MKQQILIEALKAQYRTIAKTRVLVQYVVNHFKITGQFPTEHELSVSMEVDVTVARNAIDEARKRLWRGKP